jgi:ABC-2 type transport system permease protein
MNKIWLIIQREYWTRVRKKSFIIMSILSPILLGLLMVVPIWLTMKMGDEKVVAVIDESGLFVNKLVAAEKLRFVYINETLETAKAQMKKNGLDGVLYIPKLDIASPTGFQLFSEKNFSMITLKTLEKSMEREIENQRLLQVGIEQKVLESIKANIDIKTINMTEEGEKASSSQALTVIGYFAGFAIYIFIFLYGVQVMRGVIEEKTNRIIEVMISSVKPFQLMMGKIIGIAGVALTQFVLWAAFSFLVTSIISSVFQLDRFSKDQILTTLSGMQNINDVQQALDIYQVKSQIDSINFWGIFLCFIFYFFGGYLMYAALFAGVGAVVDSETDSQQFMLPVTAPLILSIVLVSGIINDPNSKMAFWTSIFPLTSPVIMMVRMPFIGFTWEVFLSMGLLVLGFLGSVWLAARIYRIGILMYGKKITYGELRKWLFYQG